MAKEPLIAVIDDDELFRMALIDLLDLSGYRARGFASAEEFLTGDGEASCDCIVTDIHMPSMSGFDLKQFLVARGSKMPVIMITAHSEPDLEGSAAFSGAVCLLRKPFEADALIHCLDKALKF